MRKKSRVIPRKIWSEEKKQLSRTEEKNTSLFIRCPHDILLIARQRVIIYVTIARRVMSNLRPVLHSEVRKILSGDSRGKVPSLNHIGFISQHHSTLMSIKSSANPAGPSTQLLPFLGKEFIGGTGNLLIGHGHDPIATENKVRKDSFNF